MKYLLCGDFDYEQILKFAIDNSKYLSFAHNKRVKSVDRTENYNRFIITARANQVSEYEVYKFSLPRYRAGQTLILCDLNNAMKKIVLETNSFGEWDSYNYPEDVAFYNSGREVWFYTISHENMIVLDSDDENLKRQLISLGVRLRLL